MDKKDGVVWVVEAGEGGKMGEEEGMGKEN